MRRLPFLITALLLLTAIAGCKQTAADRYQRYLDGLADTTFEYLPQVRDTVVVGEEASDVEWADDDGLIAIPDIPKERSVNMGASDYELERMMSGRDY